MRDEIGADAWARLGRAREQARVLLAGRAVWHVNSTAQGGGVAEMLRTLLPYWRGDGIDARWLVVTAPNGYFRLTKRLHNMLHGAPQRALGLADEELFELTARRLASAAVRAVEPGDVVILHDPQTAGFVKRLKRVGAVVIWRCHVGSDRPSASSEAAWAFLLPHVRGADRLVFTRRAYVPAAFDPNQVRLLTPGIDPCSPKNQPLPPAAARAILARTGIGHPPRPGSGPVRVPLAENGTAEVRRASHVLRTGPPVHLDSERLVVALARWDRLKDPVGLMSAFVSHVSTPGAHLIVAGPDVSAVADDPEGAEVLAEVSAAWSRLDEEARRRVDIAALPMDDLAENALIVNALQRQAAVVVKKSIQEGFGLGVTEAMWKSKPVVASGVGGHRDQIDSGRTGLLVDDPAAFASFGSAIERTLDDAALSLSMGLAAHDRVRRQYLADRHFASWVEILNEVLCEHPGRGRSGG